MQKICAWVNIKNPEYIKYHNTEWWKPIFDDKKLFEMIVLEWAQSWLSWEVILNKRKNYKEIFFDYDLKKIIQIDEKYIEKILQNPGIVRYKWKIVSVIQNAKIFIKIQEEFWSFSNYIWNWTNWKIIYNDVQNYKNCPVKTELSERISKDLKKRGMKFVWPVTIYSYLQAIWIVNDHENDCFFKNKLKKDERNN